jgi:hypothetical protein
MNRYFAAGVAVIAAAFGVLAVPATASAEQVECASDKGRRVECPMNTRGEVRIVRQLSRAPCVDGQSWGLSKHSVWVSDGCRAVFASDGPPEQQGGGYGAPAYGGGFAGAQSYGGGGGGAAAPATVTCSSNDGGRTECDMDTRGEVRLVRQQSRAPCVEGQSWGLSKHSIWVSGGCRATFQNMSRANEGGGQGGSGGGPTPQQVSACEERVGSTAQVVSTEPLNPGSWSLVMESRGGRFACDVGPGGRVDGFQKISR